MPRRQLPQALCIDEVHVDISRVCNYAMILQDFETGEPVNMIANRRKEITEPYFLSIPFAERKQVKYLISDMYRPYTAYVDQYFPNAVSIVDSFHVIKMINDKILRYIRKLQAQYRRLDEKRHEDLEQQLGRHIEFTSSKEYYLLKHFKWLILKNADDIAYSGKPQYNYKLKRYITLGEIEKMLFDIDPDLQKIRNLKERYITFNVSVKPNCKRLTDITEFAIPAGKIYLSPIVDCFDGMLTSWTIGSSSNSTLVNKMLDKAVE